MFAYIFTVAILLIVFLSGYKYYKKRVKEKREQFIDNYIFPKKVSEMLLKTYPHLESKDLDLVIKGLRDYFHICNIAGNKMVSMPSQVVDIAWHEFILFTKKYEFFTNRALGRFLHHTPAEAMKSKTIAQDGIKLAWRIACQRESINPSEPTKLPLLFLLDSLLEISDGFKYSLNCMGKNGADYCAGHIGCGGTSCAGDSFAGDSSGCGGGCGGS